MLTYGVRRIGLIALFVSLGAFSAFGRDTHFRASMNTFEETPAIVGDGTGQFTLTLHDNMTMDFTLTFSGLTGAPAVAHIHIGQRGVAGGVTIFFCGGGGRPACPNDTSGTVTGTITAADVMALPAQGIVAGDLAAVLRAMRRGDTYANMHTAAHGGGEIRGQIKGGGGQDDDQGGED